MMNVAAQAIIDDIQTLHQHGVAAGDIARKLHLPEETIRHVIEHAALPAQHPHWTASYSDFEA